MSTTKCRLTKKQDKITVTIPLSQLKGKNHYVHTLPNGHILITDSKVTPFMSTVLPAILSTTDFVKQNS